MREPLATSALDYPLDPACIAVQPAVPRDTAKLMVVSRTTGAVEHATVRDLPRWLRMGDRLVVNRTRVIRARFKAQLAGGGPATEGLMIEPCRDGSWLALVKRSKKFRAGDVLALVGHDGRMHGDALELLARDGDGWRVRMLSHDAASTEAAIERSGWTPLPPYITKAREHLHTPHDDEVDRAWYQTVFAQRGPESGAYGSVAAPTAGLHFTPELLKAIAEMGVPTLEVNLRVGAGTFKPVATHTLAEHQMHRECCHVPHATMQELRLMAPARAQGRGRIVVVGTTTVRTLESLPAMCEWPAELTEGCSMDTSLLIQPGHEFRYVDALLTNFHLPRSTLLALVGAFVGLERLKELYVLAQRHQYRFFSYGDAMLIV